MSAGYLGRTPIRRVDQILVQAVQRDGSIVGAGFAASSSSETSRLFVAARRKGDTVRMMASGNRQSRDVGAGAR